MNKIQITIFSVALVFACCMPSAQNVRADEVMPEAKKTEVLNDVLRKLKLEKFIKLASPIVRNSQIILEAEGVKYVFYCDPSSLVILKEDLDGLLDNQNQPDLLPSGHRASRVRVYSFKKEVTK